jgi:hypothetical protein
MKKVKMLMLIIAVACLASLNSCKKDVKGCMDKTSTNYNPNATVDDGSCKYEGKVTFWYNSSGTNATVNIDGQVGTVNGSYYYTSTPACGAAYCANFTLPIGTYSYTASSSFSNWNGSITITKNGCATVLLQ